MGDFFRIGAAQDFIAAWDPWIQSALIAGQGALGAGWDASYMSAPIWRFCLPAGQAGRHAVAGVLMPSVDRVGRRFPLTLLLPLDTADPVAGYFANDRFFDWLEDLALSALDDDMSRDRLESELGAGPEYVDQAPVHGVRQMAGRDADNLRASLAARAIAGVSARPSLWTARLSDSARMMVCDGLPGASHAPGLFNLDAPIWQESAA